MAKTARDICTLALKESGALGVGQTPLAEDINDALTLFQNMVSQWQKRRWLVNALTEVSAIGTGAKSYSVGSGQAFDTPETPDKVQAAWFIQLNTGQNPVSFELSDMFSYENYALAPIKDLNSFPQGFFYTNSYPYGTICIYPAPNASYEIHLIVKANLSKPVTLDTVLILPEEYFEAIHYNLAIRLRSMYDLPAKPVLVGLGKGALQTIRNANTQIPALRMPDTLRRPRAFNIFSADGY